MESVIDKIHARGTELLQPDKSGNGYECPICHSGIHKKGTGMSTKDGVHFTCWAGCFSNADIIDIIGKVRGITDTSEKIRACCEALGINRGETMQRKEQPTTATKKPEQKQETDYTEFFLQAHNDIDKTDYHRGLSRETLDRFKVGYVKSYNAHNNGAKGWDALIIPTSKQSYVIRNTDKGAVTENRYRKQGAVHIFNIEALKTATQPIYIVEGEIDAMSIIDVGGEAVGLGSISSISRLLRELEGTKPTQPLIVSLDNDGAGEGKALELQKDIEALGIECYKYNPCGKYKDANEALQADREGFTKAVAKGNKIETEALQLEFDSYKTSKHLASFWTETNKGKKRYIPTGFKDLDQALDGGLYAGLYAVGALSGFGKTTFCLQIADRIAEEGKPVLIFSLEMSREELIAKSLSRLTAKIGGCSRARTMRDIQAGINNKGYTAEEKETICKAYMSYGKTSENVWIIEGHGDIGAEDIRQKVDSFTRLYGEAPVVVVDYLQILAPYNERATDKQNADRAINHLKQISRDYDTPVIVISSFNRESYLSPVSYSCFKESGGIEYTCDVIIGLQYDGIEEITGKNKEAEARTIIKEQKGKIYSGGETQTIQVKILKQRAGMPEASVILKFSPAFNCFYDEKEAVRRENVADVDILRQREIDGFTELDESVEVPF